MYIVNEVTILDEDNIPHLTVRVREVEDGLPSEIQIFHTNNPLVSFILRDEAIGNLATVLNKLTGGEF